jgi:hypothetical protein
MSSDWYGFILTATILVGTILTISIVSWRRRNKKKA